MNNISSPQGNYSRLRQRFLSGGIDGFLDYEVVELLLKLADNRRDQKITRKLKATCETIDVQLHDHLIIAGNDFTSMADEEMV